MSNSQVKQWFGEAFNKLHPKLQQLHIKGGELQGTIEVRSAKGLAGFIATGVRNKLNIPNDGEHQLVVTVFHASDGLHWYRCFNQAQQMRSIFRPVGDIDNGYWIEKTGPITLHLNVDINDGGWHWCCLSIRLFNIPMPLWLFPKSYAYKQIEKDQHYRFAVSFSLPLIGEFLSYGGLLELKPLTQE